MNDDIRTKLDALASKLLTECDGDAVTLDNKIDTFKAVVQYYLGCNRTKAGKKAESEAGSTFGDLIRKLRTDTHEGGTA